MTDRTDSYRKMIYDAPYEICIERAKYYTESYQETEGLHPAIRAAKALEKTLKKMTLYILDQEQIVGNRSSKLVASVIPIERGELASVIKMDLKRMKKRDYKPFQIAKEEEKLLKTYLKYWDGKTVRDMKERLWDKLDLLWKVDVGIGSWIRKYRQFGWQWLKEYYNRLIKGRITHAREGLRLLATNNPNFVNNVFDTQGHLVMGHKNILKWGFEGIKRLAEERLEQVSVELNNNSNETETREIIGGPANYYEEISESWTPTEVFQSRFSKEKRTTIDHKAFLEGVIISVDAAMQFIKRFEKLAIEKAEQESDPERKTELTRINKICSWVATNKPRDFREALQLVWFNQVIATIAHGMGGILAVGRPDQYLYPFYKADIEAGRITDEEVIELCEELFIKLSYNLLSLPDYGKATASELGGDNAALTVGGVDKEGNDAVNELSYLFMDAVENVKSMTNSFSIRIHPEKNPRKWVERTIEVYSKTSGPAVFNDTIIVPALEKTGVSLEDARDYAIIGCVEPTSQGNTFGTTSGNDISLVGLLEMVLTNGSIRTVNKDYGLVTGDPEEFTSYEDIWNAYISQLKHMIDHMVKCVNVKDIIYTEYYPNPFISMTLDGCLENALDMTQGGAKYNFSSISGRGLATTADSLAVLKKIIFEDKLLSMEEMVKILNRHYKKNETYQTMFKNKVPKFGNDNDYVDSIAKDIAYAFCDEVAKNSCLRTPGLYRPSFFSYGMYIVDGFLLGATPDGRNAGDPVSNSLSPANNMERSGPTAVLKSITKIDHTKISNGMALNMKLLPTMLDSSEKREKVMDFLMAYFELGGQEIQFNVVNQEDLINAQLYPEKYSDLVVRVSGYSAYFTDLGKPVQDDIIARFQFCEF